MTAITTLVDDLDPVNCRMCGHGLHAERSRRLHLGPVCRRRITNAIALPGWRVDGVVGVDRGALAIVLVAVAGVTG